MRVKSRIAYFLTSAVASQLLLGCQPGEKEEERLGPKISVPADMTYPSELVGKWLEAKGKQTVQLNADGSGEIIAKITLGANVTKGAAKSFDQKQSMKWGVKDKTFYFTDIKGSPPLSYDWSMVDGKLLLNNNGSKLTYSSIEDKQKK